MNTQIILLMLMVAIGLMLCVIAVSLFRVKRNGDKMLDIKMSRIFHLIGSISSIRSAIYRHEAKRGLTQVNS